jgi:peptidoglycan-associated lipoprotein
MRFKALGLLAAVAMLAACETPREQTAATTSTAAPPAAAPTARQRSLQEILVSEVGDRVFFDYDKSELKPEARRQVERWAAFLRQYPNATVTVEGHADERGTREYNLGLGERRAAAVRDYLVGLGIAAERIAIVSKGKESPVCSDKTEPCWQQNRRGHFIVTAK